MNCTPVIYLGETLDPATKTLTSKSERISLTKTETRILYALMSAQGQAVSKDDLDKIIRSGISTESAGKGKLQNSLKWLKFKLKNSKSQIKIILIYKKGLRCKRSISWGHFEYARFQSMPL